ncbi:MAG: right-handed parallel beta-helix repeat-containing protein [Planctomycetota bacterium]|jgi:parallel beta-helix repeat protein/predicted outer membrane repeat protein
MKNLIVTFTFFFLTLPCTAIIITVDANGTGDYLTIQAAINAASDYDIIELQPGTYTGPGNRDIDFLGKAIAVQSIDPNNPNIVAATVINCSGTEDKPHRGFHFHQSEDSTSVLAGVTLTGGYASRGGGIYLQGSSPTVEDCIIYLNTATWGAGAYIDGGSPIFYRCIFLRNTASKYAGGIFNRSANPLLINCRFLGNSVDVEEGASTSYFGGGAIYSYACGPEYVNCVFSGNSSERYGGAIYGNSSYPTLTNCTFSLNSAEFLGGAIYNPTNIATPMTIHNTVFWDSMDIYAFGNEESQIYSGTKPSINYCCIQGWTGQWGGIGNISDNPKFIDADGADNIPGTLDDDLRLLPVSPSIDAGNNDAVGPDTMDVDKDGNFVEPIPIDLDADPRFLDIPEVIDTGNSGSIGGAIVDMGAYENPKQGIWLSTNSIRVPEGLSAVFTVAITEDPSGTVQVTIIIKSGDPDIEIGTGMPLIFNSSNYQEPQEVTLLAAEDEDDKNGTSGIVATALGLRDVGLEAEEWDNEVPPILHVDCDVPGENLGTSWMDALSDLQEAIGYAKTHPPVEQIRVARGVYRPGPPGADPVETFSLVSGVEIKGGYAGFGEPNADARDTVLYETILSGDLNCDDGPDFTNVEDNSYHVVCAYRGVEPTAVLDGFTITAGNANGSYPHYYGGGMRVFKGGGPTVHNCKFVANIAAQGGGVLIEGFINAISCLFQGNKAGNGGAIFCRNDHRTMFKNCWIIGNTAGNYGGGFCDLCHAPIDIIQCIIANNDASYGGGIGRSGFGTGKLTITNCTIVDNIASGGYTGGGIAGGCTVTNTILWGNEPGQKLYANCQYCDIQAGGTGTNIDADPCFVDGYHLARGSPCIDAGTNNPPGGLPETDLDGIVRPQDGDCDFYRTVIADIGAYEYVWQPNEPVMRVLESEFSTVTWEGVNPDDFLLHIRNTGSDILLWEIIEDYTWLQCIPSSGSSAGEIDEALIRVDVSQLALGDHLAVIAISDGFNSPHTVTVSIRVNGAIEVPSEYPTIQAAIDAAINGDIVIVEPGTYTGEGNFDLDFHAKAITVRSTNPNDPNIVAATVIDCNGSEEEPHRGFYFHSGEEPNSILEGFTITNGWGPKQCDWGLRSCGGAILCQEIYIPPYYIGSNPTIRNCIITGNYADYGGGIYLDDSDPTVANCEVISNYASRGGGIYGDDCRPNIVNCTICYNISYGVYFRYWSDPLFENCVIRNNTGPGVYFYAFCRPTFNNCFITENSRGGIDCDGGLYINGCIISNNGGSGIACGDCLGLISNCTVTNNSTTSFGGGGIYCRDSTVTVNNCILWGNSDRDGMDESAQFHASRTTFSIDYSCIQGLTVTGALGGTGNIGKDPLFVDLWNSDYRLRCDSPCIDTGDNNSIAADTTDLDGDGNTTELIPWDLDGNPRIVDGNEDSIAVVDMGAYEFIPAIEVEMKFTPQALNCNSKGRWVKAHFVLPEEFSPEDVDTNEPAVAELMDSEIQSDYMNVFVNKDGLVEIEAAFSRADFCSSATVYRPLDVTVRGMFNASYYFYGTDTIKIINKNLEYLATLASYWLNEDCRRPDWCGGLDIDHSSTVDFIDFAKTTTELK